MKLSLLAFALALSASNARAATKADAILNHPVLVAFESMLNQKHNGTCRLPAAESDIHWACLGALPILKKPTIVTNGCFFSVNIECEGETARVSGSTESYFLANAKGIDSSVEPVSTVNVDGISFQ